MLWRGQRESENVEDRRGVRGKKTALSGGVVALALLATYMLGGDPIKMFVSMNRAGYVQMPWEQRSGSGKIDHGDIEGVGQDSKQFVAAVLGSTEDVWSKILTSKYTRPRLILFSDSVNSACGYATAASGPFYCPGDHKLYLDLSFFHQLRQLGASGDFAAAYVIGHEVGHHVQTILGVANQVSSFQQRASKTEGNAMQVRMELQADCYAGIWANQSQMLEQGDVEEGLDAASAVGDDNIQKTTSGTIRPESFTHGTSKQRKEFFMRGFNASSIEDCNTFKS